MSDDRKYGLASLIHVLGGLPLRGCAYLLYGKPGIGKSALAFGVLCELGQGGICGHYISSEQSAIDLVRMAYRAKVPKKASILIQSACGMQDIATAIDGRKSAVYVVDSIHSITDASALDVAATLSRLAMDKDVVIFAIAHTNAAGGLDGGDRLREPFAKVLRLRAHGEAADPHRILETEATPRRRALFKMHEGRMLDCGPLPNEEA
jgi:predicted ATP-dependent serine protease